MSDNPYQPPQSPPTIRPSRKALVGLTILSMLSVPASAIAGAVTCTSLAPLMDSRIALACIPIGVLTCLAIVLAALIMEERARTGIGWRQIRPALRAVSDFQVAALPLVFVATFIGGMHAYSFVARSNGKNAFWVGLALGSVINLGWSWAAYIAWRRWFRNQAERDLL